MSSAKDFQARADAALEMSQRPENQGMRKIYLKLWAHWCEEAARARDRQESRPAPAPARAAPARMSLAA